METKPRIGGIAGYVAAAAYLIAAAGALLGMLMVDPMTDNAGMNSAAMYVVFTAAVFLGTIAAALTLRAALQRVGGFSGGLAKAALVFAVLAAVGSFFAWAFIFIGILLSIAFALLALRLHADGSGITGKPSLWDWVIPVAFPLGALTMVGLYVFDVVEMNEDDIDWGYTTGFTVAMVLAAAALAQAGRWLSTSQQPAEGPNERHGTPEPRAAGL